MGEGDDSRKDCRPEKLFSFIFIRKWKTTNKEVEVDYPLTMSLVDT